MSITTSRLLSAALLTVLALCASAQDKLAIKAGRIYTTSKAPPIDGGTIVIVNGRITAIGTEVEIPWDAPVIDGQKLTAMAGFVEAHTSRGLDRANENVDVAPFLSVRDSIDPIAFAFEDYLRWGVTTINVQQGANCVVGGQGLVVKPFGLTIEEMLVKPDAGLKLSASPKSGFSSATQAQALRNAFADLRRQLEALVAEKKDGSDRARREALFQGREQDPEKLKGKVMGGSAWKVDGLDRVPRGEIDEKIEPLLALVEGRLAAFFYCARPMDVRLALEVARDNGFLARTTLVIRGECWKAADTIAEAGVPVILDGPQIVTERDPFNGKEKETFVPGVLEQKSIRFALTSSNTTTESLWYQAALAVGNGLSREKAIDAVTLAPAQMLGLGKRLGTLEVGKDGNVVLYSGEPLSVNAWVEHVVLEGKPVYDRSKDIRVKAILEGRLPAGTEPMGASGDKPNVCCDGDHGDGEHPKEDKDGEKGKDDGKDEKKDEKKQEGGN